MPRDSFSSPQPIFKGRIIAAAGPLPDKNTVENFKHWAKLRKGEFTTTFDESVTHLLCSDEQFKAENPVVKKALGHKCHIVRYEWFLLSMGGEEAAQPEEDHDLRAGHNRRKRKEQRMMRLEKGRRLARRFIDPSPYSRPLPGPQSQAVANALPDLYQIFVDDLLFSYKVELTRLTRHDPDPPHERGLYESNAKPHLYWFAAKYSKSKGDTQPHYYRETEFPTLRRAQMGAFKAFFQLKTGIRWSERIIRDATMPAEYFQYTPPTGGKSTGRDKLWSRYFCFELNRALRGLNPEKTAAAEDQERGVKDGRGAQSGVCEVPRGCETGVDSGNEHREPLRD
ncbi:anthranilate synthase component II [Metarhizium album ARSEF 1941]|uniref:Anthranilate synthase component II n=1 Tax=Metarhizium album (strain ARSEF 1941) TaxID=1081103 RepID=A0A0B2WX09_METAS|nr:anthranilate synthase component II [Metarhizium album ARSEF 1941]KHO00737.1 anthranilate synthase component II [Metarhizium album ARSEF 1941]